MVLVAYKVMDGHVPGLAVPVEPSVSLLELGWVPGAVVVEHVAGRTLEVETLGRCISGEQDTHRPARVVEGAFDKIPLNLFHPAEEREEALLVMALPHAAYQIVEGGLVLGEDHEPLIVAP